MNRSAQDDRVFTESSAERADRPDRAERPDRDDGVVRSQLRRQQRDTWLACSGMIAALLALPLAQSTWHGPEVAAVIAIAATALFAGQRWAIAVIVIAELFLVPTLWPRVLLGNELDSRILALVTLCALVPGVLSLRRAAVALVVMTGLRRSRQMYRRMFAALLALATIAVIVPLI